MGVKAGLAALCVAAFVCESAAAQDVSLVAREAHGNWAGTIPSKSGDSRRN